jgi:hypothetical protein
MTGEYEKFASRVRRAGRAYEMDLDERHLDELATLLDGVPADAADPSDGWRVTVSGWLRRGVAFPARPADDTNTVIRVHRFARPELGWRSRLIRHGFRLEADTAHDRPSLPLLGAEPDGALRALHASNTLAASQLTTIGATAAEPGDPMVGYVDRISVAPRTRPDGTGWLDAIACDAPEALWDFIQSAQGASWRGRLAAALDLHEANARWADRFRLVSEGLAGEYRSDLVPLRVVARDTADDDPLRTLTTHELVRDGSLVRPIGAEVRFPAPNPSWHRLRDVRLQDGGVVTQGEDLVLYEEAADPRRDFVSGTWQTLFGNSVHPDAVLLDRRPAGGPPIPEAILIGGRSDFNWFHWSVEYLPRVLAIPAEIAHDVPVLVSSRTPATGVEALRMLTDRRIETVDADTSREVSLLHVTAPVAQVLDSPRVEWGDGLRLDVPALRRLRRRWLDAADNPTGERNIFLRRGPGRRGISNEEKLVAIARARGFDIVSPEQLSFAEQLELYASARVLAGASGAVMANYLMMPAGARVLALTSDRLWDFSLPAALAHVADVEFAYVTGRTLMSLSAAPERNSWLHSDYSIDPRDFERGLDWVAAGSGRTG